MDACTARKREAATQIAYAESLPKGSALEILVAGNDEVSAARLEKVPVGQYGDRAGLHRRVLHVFGAGAQVKCKTTVGSKRDVMKHEVRKHLGEGLNAFR